jgi:putative membrane protein
MKHGMTSAFVLLSIVLTATSHAQDYPGYRHMWGDWGWGHTIFGSFVTVLFWGWIILAVVLLVRWLGGRSTAAVAPPPGKMALDMLKERFARGEIDKDEFEERKRLLSE